MKMNFLRGAVAVGAIALLHAAAPAEIVGVPGLNFHVGVPDDWRPLTSEELSELNNKGRKAHFEAGYCSKDGTPNIVAFQTLPGVDTDPKANISKLQATMDPIKVEWDEQHNCVKGLISMQGLTDRMYIFFGGKNTVAMHCLAPATETKSSLRKHEAMASTFRFDHGYAMGEYNWFMDHIALIGGIAGGVALVWLFKSRRSSF